MCNLYGIRVRRWEMQAYFQADDDFRREIEREDVYPGYDAPIVRQHEGARQLTAASWGFPTREPRKRAPKEGQSPFVITRWTNARNLSSNMWRPFVAQPAHRCLVPFSRFAEPRAAADRVEGGDRNWWFTVEDQEIPCFAGIWKADPELGLVFAFLTTEPNPLVAPKHPKAMPVVLLREDHDRWLSCGHDEALTMQAPYPSQMMALAE
jgi:putative SOS response-associated peptidase YedK